MDNNLQQKEADTDLPTGTSFAKASTQQPEPAVGEDSKDRITAEEVANGMDLQGIPWENLPFSRKDYRSTRLRDAAGSLAKLGERFRQDVESEPDIRAKFYEFFETRRNIKPSITHFQLRNLVSASSEADVFSYVGNGSVVHWDTNTEQKSTTLALAPLLLQFKTQKTGKSPL